MTKRDCSNTYITVGMTKTDCSNSCVPLGMTKRDCNNTYISVGMTKRDCSNTYITVGLTKTDCSNTCNFVIRTEDNLRKSTGKQMSMSVYLNICGSVHHACSEIIPRCNNCGLIFPNALLYYMFRVTIPPIIRSTFAVPGHR